MRFGNVLLAIPLTAALGVGAWNVPRTIGPAPDGCISFLGVTLCPAPKPEPIKPIPCHQPTTPKMDVQPGAPCPPPPTSPRMPTP